VATPFYTKNKKTPKSIKDRCDAALRPEGVKKKREKDRKEERKKKGRKKGGERKKKKKQNATVKSRKTQAGA
jgi:hypothetical protein